ncbi:metallophosphoesterase [uncultured Cytophaga sp.]|uniref:metallophosphoesterase n=1 Tax=uncultured Cytophaga sp. TaxID=160238 RepID=UPI00262A0ADB|nr:metallophosphoesterase [uncultured Cytophaga sp.]
MTLQYASDLHLEFSQNRDFMKANPIQPKAEVLVLAGDVVPFNVMHKHADFFKYVSDHFEAVYWVPGNHEYYNSDLMHYAGSLLREISTNVFLVNNTSVQVKDVHLIFSTMWTKISDACAWDIERGMSDFHCITKDGKRFSAAMYNQLHEESLAFLRQELKSTAATKKLVVTHHVPTYMHYPAEYKGSVLSEAFAIELFDLIEANGPDAWIYGHHHGATPDFEIGKTNMLTNQLGYVKYGEHGLFNPESVFNI